MNIEQAETQNIIVVDEHTIQNIAYAIRDEIRSEARIEHQKMDYITRGITNLLREKLCRSTKRASIADFRIQDKI